MRRARPTAVVGAIALLGALGTLTVGAGTGMNGSELRDLGLLLLAALALTLVASAAAWALLARASIRWRFAALAGLAALLSLANLAILTISMSVSHHDATLVAILLVYSLAAGVGAAHALARSWGDATDALSETARRLAGGDLDARVGRLGAGPELDALGLTLDRMSAQLQDSFERERANEATRKDLITAVSHDLRTPLASVRAMVEAVDERIVEDPATLQRYAGEMRRSVGALTKLVDDLFELVQIDAGAIEAESERMKLAGVIETALAACGPEAAEKGLLVETQLDGAGDFACSPRMVRVLQNLLQNAIRHTPPDGTVVVQARRLRSTVELLVSDSGEGIAPEALASVFEPFWRGDAARAGSRSGLGLALAKRIVEALGGEIRVESGRGRGARFAVQLPESS